MLWGLFLIIGLFFPGWARAEGEFTTNYNVDYRVEANGLTQARMNVELINKLSNIYASEFTLSIGSTSLTNIRLQTASGPVEPKITLGNKTTNITVIFPEKILGKDKAQQFTLEFTTSDFSRRLGNVWEISIPKLAKAESLSSYRLTLAVPAAFVQAATLTGVDHHHRHGQRVEDRPGIESSNRCLDLLQKCHSLSHHAAIRSSSGS